MKIKYIFLLLIFSTTLKAQFITPNEVPNKIKETLDSIYPNNKFPVWRTSERFSNMLKYEATFTYDGRRTWVKLDSLSHLIEIETELDPDSIPNLSKEYITKHYDLKSVFAARKIITKNKFLYFVSIRGIRPINTHSLLFTEDGKFFKKKHNLHMSSYDFAQSSFREFIFLYPYIF